MLLTRAYFKNDNKITTTTKINQITGEVVDLTVEEIKVLEKNNFQNNLIYVTYEINVDILEYENTEYENDLIKTKLQLLKDYYNIDDINEFDNYFTFKYLNYE